MYDQEKVTKDILVTRIKKDISEEKRLVGKIIGRIKQARKKMRVPLNINEKQLRVNLNGVIKTWEKNKVQKIIDQFLAEIKTSLQRKESILLWGYCSLEVHQRLSQAKNRIRFRAGPKLTRTVNPLNQKKAGCPTHQLLREQHKTANCCDKSQGIKGYNKCSRFRELQKQIRECSHCNLN